MKITKNRIRKLIRLALLNEIKFTSEPYDSKELEDVAPEQAPEPGFLKRSYEKITGQSKKELPVSNVESFKYTFTTSDGLRYIVKIKNLSREWVIDFNVEGAKSFEHETNKFDTRVFSSVIKIVENFVDNKLPTLSDDLSSIRNFVIFPVPNLGNDGRVRFTRARIYKSILDGLSRDRPDLGLSVETEETDYGVVVSFSLNGEQ